MVSVRTTVEPTVVEYARKYDYISNEVILKEDVLRRGMTFSPQALARVTGCRTQSYYLFSYNMSSYDELGHDVSFGAPEDVQLVGGPLGLRRTCVRVVLSAKSPYRVELVDDKLLLRENGVALTEVVVPKKPPYYGRKLPNGQSYEQVVPLLGNHFAFVTTFRVCHYWGDKEECKFCDINAQTRELRKQYGDHVSAAAIKNVSDVATIVTEMVDEQSPDFRVASVLMTGGSITRPVQGGADNAADFNIPYVEAIRAKIGGRTPVVLITESQPIDKVKALKAAGVTSHNTNLEVWDKRLFGIIAPGKEKYVGYDRWVANLYDAVYTMGEGNVSPNMISGIEMAQPFGFDNVSEALASATEGFEQMMSRGVIPHLDTWCVEPGSRLRGHEPIPLDFLLLADVAWHETWRKYNLPAFTGYGPMGAPGVAFYGNTASVDIG
jgi:hypothetical protein